MDNKAKRKVEGHQARIDGLRKQLEGEEQSLKDIQAECQHVWGEWQKHTAWERKKVDDGWGREVSASCQYTVSTRKCTICGETESQRKFEGYSHGPGG